MGPKDPYYSVLMCLLGELGWNLEKWPTLSEPVVYSENDKLFYTYHPNSLQRTHNFNDTCIKASKFIK